MQYAKCVNNQTYFKGDLADTFEPDYREGLPRRPAAQK